MKKIILAIALLMTAFSVSSQATEKICFHSDGDQGDRGDYFTTEITTEKLSVNTVVGEASWDGEFPISRQTINGRDGKTYLSYYTNGDDGCDTVLVNKDLLQAGTTGLIKFRCRGEGFGEAVFFCRDSK